MKKPSLTLACKALLTHHPSHCHSDRCGGDQVRQAACVPKFSPSHRIEERMQRDLKKKVN